MAWRWLLILSLPLVFSQCGRSNGPQPMPPSPTVTVAKPLVRNLVDWDEYTGRFTAVETVELRARVSGYLDAINFRDGQLVEKGQVLFEIDPRPFQAALDRAVADQKREQTRLDLAISELARSAKLLTARAISQEEYDTRLQTRREAEAAVVSAAAAAHSAALDLEFTTIRSPISGRIGARQIDVGNLVSGGSSQSTLLATIVSLDPIYFDFDASEADYLRYDRLNVAGSRKSSRDVPNPVYVRLMDENDWSRLGKMNFVDNQINPGTGTLHGRAIFANGDGFLLPGTFGRLRLIGSGAYDAILIPDDAITFNQAIKIVMTVDQNGVVVPKPVTLGPLDYGLRVVRSGLSAEDRVVINGLMHIRPGARVNTVQGLIVPAATQ